MSSEHEHDGNNKRHAHSLLDGEPREHEHTCDDLAACQAVLDGVLRLYDLCWQDDLFKACLRAAFDHADSPPYPVDITEKERLEIAFTMVVGHLNETAEQFAEKLATTILMRALANKSGATLVVLGEEGITTIENPVEDSEKESMVDRAIRLAMETAGKPAEEEE